jgi:hypothetical protein
VYLKKWLLLCFASFLVTSIFGSGVIGDPLDLINRDSLVIVTANPLEFETRYIEYDPVSMNLILQNYDFADIQITALVFQDDETVFSTNALLPITVSPFDTCGVQITFNPLVVGNYRDTLFVFCGQDTIPAAAIGLKGRCEHIPPNAVDNLVLTIQGNDAHLTWDEVTTDMYGNPFDVDGYLVLYNETVGNNPEHYVFLWETGNLFFTHPDVVLYSPRQFYQVVAYKLYDDDRRELLRSMSGHRIKAGKLKMLLSDPDASLNLAKED